MPIYDRPTKVLMRDFAKEKLKPDQIFSKQDAVDWFKIKYPKIRFTTVQLHVEGMSTNSTARKHHKNIRPETGFDLFFKIAPGKYRLWNLETDPHPLYDSAENNEKEQPFIPEDDEPEASIDSASSEFAFEHDLRNYLAKNIDSLEKGLKLYKDEDGAFYGIEFPAGGRRIDILAINPKSEFVVIELKVSRGYDRTIGQILRYMGWIEKNLAEDKKVHGIIVAREITEDLKLAASRIQGIKLVEYEIAFKLKKI